jgi:hypothetical protein
MARSIVAAVIAALVGVTVFSTPASAVRTFSVISSYNVTLDVIEWEVSITQDGTGSLTFEAPFTLTPDTTGFAVNLRANGSASQTAHGQGGADSDANGTGAQTWYYNETAVGSAILLWNTTGIAGNQAQIFRSNPFLAGTLTEGLWLDTAGNRLFAAFGSGINVPQPVQTLHIASHDGILNWSNVLIAESSGSNSFTGFTSSINKADMNANGIVNGLDINPFILVLTNLPAYNAGFPGLDGMAWPTAWTSPRL